MGMNDNLLQRLKELNMNGVAAHWSEVAGAEWVKQVVQWEESERGDRSLQRRLRDAKLGRFKILADFDWTRLGRVDRGTISELMSLSFLDNATNVVLSGPSGVGKTTLAKNVAHQALVSGHSVVFRSASEMLEELAAIDVYSALRRRLRKYTGPDLLVIDQLGFVAYSNRHADLLFEVISQRYERKSTIVTTNKPFREWSDVFPSSGCVVALVDRLLHHSEVISIEAESWRLKEAGDDKHAKVEKAR